MTDRFRVTSTSSDAELISAARSGSARAYDLLADRHAPAALRFASLLTPSPAEAGEIVAETLARVLHAIRSGAGPSEAFRPYLLTGIRRATLDRVHGQHSQRPPGAEIAIPGAPLVDLTAASLERSLTVKAFRALPERWAAVLWHAEVEHARPAELALLLGTSADAVAEATERAIEGLRRAYLQIYRSVRRQPECRRIAGKLGDHLANRLPQHEQVQVTGHLGRCRDCGIAHAELTGIDAGLRGMVARAVLGEKVADYLRQIDRAADAGVRSRLRHMRALIWRRQMLPVAACVAAAAIGLPTVRVIYPRIVGAPLPPRTAPPAAIPPGAGGPGTPVTGAAHPVSRARPYRWTPLTGSGAIGPSGSSSMSAAPSPTGQVTPSPSPRSGSGSPAPSPSALRSSQGAMSAKLSLSVVVGGSLDLGAAYLIAVDVYDPGTAATGKVSATVSLPAGITLQGLGPSSAGWTCSGASCQHGPLAAGAASTVSFRVLVVSLVGCGNVIAATAVSGPRSASGSAPANTGCGG
jgi:DNA-directed RNA polymerase specialized sigma24 family protein